MAASPLSALDLPLKILLWENQEGAAHASFNAPSYLSASYELSDDVAGPIRSVEALAEGLTKP